MDYVNDGLKLYQQTEFWLRLAGGVVIWYFVAILFAHLLFGGGREAVPSTKSGMWLSMGVIFLVLIGGCYYWLTPGNWVAVITLGITYVLIVLVLTLALGRFGGEQ
ncbi:hypothetical protein [Deinococcus roseus]|uniref:Uncharacterized protein n=1 Tax=Deinococcus roseus TaxID=392414 RepID=A0ABQ2CVW2_9DEIO|nr:hypothetical protein [Deinococcus roseus]GGJ26076.1 hypothetical protein GCM10008938_10270 [Deinococcus roseus]